MFATHRAPVPAEARGLIVLACATALAFAAALTGPTRHVLAQDRFGAMVAVSGAHLFVGKPGAARGPAAVYRYRIRHGPPGWTLEQTLSPPGTAESGDRLSPSMLVSSGRLLVGAGDADVMLGSHIFSVEDDGSWVHAASPAIRNPSDRPTPTSSGERGSATSLAEIMRVLQPPQRVVAADGDAIAVLVPPGTGVAAGGGTSPTVQVFRESGVDWVREATIAPPSPEETRGFGQAMALADGELFVSSSGLDGAGAVHVYAAKAGESSWPLVTTLAPEGADSLEVGARFGSALARHGDWLVAGAPGASESAGLVFAYRRDDRGAWQQEHVARPPSTDPGQRFGSAVALWEERLWVGAPGANEVHRFVFAIDGWEAVPRPPYPGEPPLAHWEASRAAERPELPTNMEFGYSVALGAGAAVVGAPGADGGVGRALTFYISPEDGLMPGEWLAPHEPLAAVTDGEVRCEDGEAAGFSCDGVELLAFLPLSAIGGDSGERVSDVWGWTDPVTRREYALVGRTRGAAVVDVTDPASPRYVGLVRANPSGARDLKVYEDHLFFTGDGAGNHGLVVFDLARLREATATGGESGHAEPIFEPDAVYDGIASAHNLVLDTESGFAFPVGASGGGETCGGGLHMVDVRNPKSPVFAGCFTDTEGLIYPGRTHDAQCVVYRGPDDRYRGRELCFASNETALRIVDVTDKGLPVPVGTATYPGLAYVHQGWLTEDQRYYYLNDELDELAGTAERTRTYIFDVAEVDDPVLVGAVNGPDGATDHNLYIKGDRMYQANYQAGFRVLDISDPESPREIGWFDTTPYEGNPPGFVGAWTAYPFFDSGIVVVTSMYEGLFVLRPRARPLIP